MRWPPFRFRRLGSKLILLLAGLIAVVQVTVYVLISRENEQNAVTHINQNLELAARIFRDTLEQRIVYLTGAAEAMSGDYAIRRLLMQDPPDEPTLRSNLDSYADRVQSRTLTLFAIDETPLARTDDSLKAADLAPFIAMIREASAQELDQKREFAYLGGRLHVLVVVPVYAPFPNVAAWFGIAYPIGDDFAQSLKKATLTDVTFMSDTKGEPARVLSTTLDSAHAEKIAQQAIKRSSAATQIIDLGDDDYVTLFEPLVLAQDRSIVVALQRPLSAELTQAKELEEAILAISTAALLAATIAALIISHSVSSPLRQLARHANSVAAGDYSRHLQLARQDELGQLAVAFNQMTDGLADRDRVRDLLGKVVSPEIATKLLQSEVTLGGEEREVTVMFCDLRDFTTLSERMAPTEVLTLLNRYLDRMSAVIEKHGGVIDKFIGDAIMALFGAPVALPDAANRAVAAAREMADAIHAMNLELIAEHRKPLEFGIGINTSRVVAGNMGSQTRLNYTVVGDGVNLAARLESLTKNRSFATNVIVSEFTAQQCDAGSALRPLGQVTVKGKTDPIKIFSVDVSPRPWEIRENAESGLL
ncbi:adenylate/guanylate cyclase domain-containing protein [Oleiharenicola lentus]|uniref:adenylate/guanylate cyclase domain-containing protein n=1 Tax=Oleiharenicola lentus TaxID=2508720 RepID=UPI003F671EAB